MSVAHSKRICQIIKVSSCLTPFTRTSLTCICACSLSLKQRQNTERSMPQYGLESSQPSRGTTSSIIRSTTTHLSNYWSPTSNTMELTMIKTCKGSPKTQRPKGGGKWRTGCRPVLMRVQLGVGKRFLGGRWVFIVILIIWWRDNNDVWLLKGIGRGLPIWGKLVEFKNLSVKSNFWLVHFARGRNANQNGSSTEHV